MPKKTQIKDVITAVRLVPLYPPSCKRQEILKVAAEFGVSERTVYRWVKVAEEQGIERLGEYGRRRPVEKRLSGAVDDEIMKCLIAKPDISYRDIAGYLRSNGIAISHTSVMRIMRKPRLSRMRKFLIRFKQADLEFGEFADLAEMYKLLAL